jgi:hypothetical protein
MNRPTAIVITNITSFVVFMISFLLLVKFYSPMKAALCSRIRRSIAKVNTETTLDELYVKKLSNSSLPR